MVLEVMTATRAEQQAVIGVITLAFSTDPAARWVYADPREYLAYVPAWVNAFGGRALDHASAWYVEGFLGAAMWLPPGIHPDHDALAALIGRTVPETRRQQLSEAADQMGGYHPAEPY